MVAERRETKKTTVLSKLETYTIHLIKMEQLYHLIWCKNMALLALYVHFSSMIYL